MTYTSRVHDNFLKNESASPKKVILSCLAGNTLEWFDFAVYGYVAPLISSQFFPGEHSTISLLLMYGIFALGFFARPLGALLFGYIGDVQGRKKALVLSSLCMAIPTFCIGLLPTYEQIGFFAPLLLLICRIFQGLSVGGEFTGSFIYLTEYAPPKRKGFFSCWADVGCSLGMILGSSTVAFITAVLSKEDFASFGWRIPFLCGLLLACIGIYMRSQLTETRDFIKTEKTHQTPLKEFLTIHPQKLFSATLILTINAVGYYILVVFIPNQSILLGKLTTPQALLLNNIALFTIIFATILSASMGDFIDRIKIYKAGSFGCMMMAYPLFYSMNTHDFTTTLFSYHILPLILFSVFLGMCFGPRPTVLVNSFSVHVRFTAIGLIFSLANGIFGGTSPLIATFLTTQSGISEMPTIMIFIASTLTLMGLNQLQKILRKEASSAPRPNHCDKAA